MHKVVLASLMLCAGGAFAQNTGYVEDPRGEAVKTNSNLCVHTGSWNPSNATPWCDSELLPKPPPPKPAPVAFIPTPPSSDILGEPVAIVVPAHVLFVPELPVLTEEGKKALTDVISRYPFAGMKSIAIVNHTDDINESGEHQTLDEERAQAVAAFFAESGVQKWSVRPGKRG